MPKESKKGFPRRFGYTEMIANIPSKFLN